MKISSVSILFAVAILLSPASARSAELFTNGDFESGTTGFGSDYSFNGVSATLDGQFSITTSPHIVHPSWSIFADHTVAGDMMLVANGSTAAGLEIWRQTVSVLPAHDYTFSGWAASVFPASPAELSFRVNDVQFETLLLTSATGVWTNFTAIVNSGVNSTLEFEIVDLNLEGNGNDFALDDLSLDGEPVPEPATVLMLAIGGFLLVLRMVRRPSNG
ncbi:MAG: PEP-CTERM sorting domain-containing protein [Pirellulales bacterium]